MGLERLPIEEPLAHALGTDLVFVDPLGIDVPIEGGPFHTAAVAIFGKLEGVIQECHANASMAMRRFDKEVFEVERGFGEEAGVGFEEEGVGDGGVGFGYKGQPNFELGWLGFETVLDQPSLRFGRGQIEFFEVREGTDEAEKFGGIVAGGSPNGDGQ